MRATRLWERFLLFPGSSLFIHTPRFAGPRTWLTIQAVSRSAESESAAYVTFGTQSWDLTRGQGKIIPRITLTALRYNPLSRVRLHIFQPRVVTAAIKAAALQVLAICAGPNARSSIVWGKAVSTGRQTPASRLQTACAPLAWLHRLKVCGTKAALESIVIMEFSLHH